MRIVEFLWRGAAYCVLQIAAAFCSSGIPSVRDTIRGERELRSDSASSLATLEICNAIEPKRESSFPFTHRLTPMNILKSQSSTEKATRNLVYSAKFKGALKGDL